MQKVAKGSIKTLIVIVLAVVVAGGAFIFSRGGSLSEDAMKEVAAGTVKIAADKGKEVMEEKGTEVLEAGKQMAADKAEVVKEQAMEKGKEAMDGAVDKAVAEGKDAVNAAMKDAGDKMLGDDAAGTFEGYAPEKIAASGGAVLDFAADWCPSCRAFEKDVAKNVSQIPADLTILRADYDKEADLKKKYGVTQQHTFVQVDAQGNQLAKWSGSPTLEALLTKVQ